MTERDSKRERQALPHWPRMLNRGLAARYCGMSAGTFQHRCPVPPTDFGDRRIELFDKHDLDEWLDSRKNGTGGVVSVADALAEFRRENGRTREKP